MKHLQMATPSYKQILTKDPFHSYETLKEEPEPSMSRNINTSLEMPELATQPSMENNFSLLKKWAYGLFKVWTALSNMNNAQRQFP